MTTIFDDDALATNTVSTNIAQPQQTVEAVKAAIDRALDDLGAPRLVGYFMGLPVYLSGRLPDAMVEIHTTSEVVRFRLDHPLIKDTRFYREIMEARGP